MSLVADLYATLQKRCRPEDIAAMILAVEKLSDAEKKILSTAARGSYSHRWSSMPDEFRRAVAPERQLRTAEREFGFPKLTAQQCADPEIVSGVLDRAMKRIKAVAGHLDFKKDRINAPKRKETPGLKKLSRRQYNKRFRLVARLTEKLEKYQRELRMCDAGMVAKSGLATRITKRAFTSDPAAACFIAYFVARKNRRSLFTNVGQESPFDKIAEMLLGRIDSGWFAAAHVFPDRRVIDKLDRRQQTKLLLMALEEMRSLAELLRAAWSKSQFDRAKMIVKRGDDSSTWNALAGAWNQLRHEYFAVIAALGAEKSLEAFCPGKIMRLMAADVAAWHRVGGGDVDPATTVWAILPPPWEVLSGKIASGSAEVVKACKVCGLDPYGTGWIPRLGEARTIDFVPTPELVHGVAVATPELRNLLSRAGWFSGRLARHVETEAEVERDSDGFAVGVK